MNSILVNESCRDNNRLRPKAAIPGLLLANARQKIERCLSLKNLVLRERIEVPQRRYHSFENKEFFRANASRPITVDHNMRNLIIIVLGMEANFRPQRIQAGHPLAASVEFYSIYRLFFVSVRQTIERPS